MHIALRNWDEALIDATKSVGMDGAYIKGWYRKVMRFI